MGVFTFVCRSSGGEWSAKQLSGDLEASASSTFDLQRRLVQAALCSDSSGPVQSSFSLVTPSSAVFQVVIGGGGGGGAFIGGGAVAAGGSSAPAAAPEAPAEEKKEEKEESDDDMDISELKGIILNKVLLVSTKSNTYIGKPVVQNAAVHAVVEDHGLNRKVIVFKYKKKKKLPKEHWTPPG